MKKSGILKCVRPDTWRPKAQQNLPSWTNNGNGSARGQLDTALSAWGEPRKGGCHVCSLPKRRQKQVLPVLQPFHDQPRHFSTCAGRTMPETPWQTPDATTEDAAAPGGPRCGPTQDAIHRGATRGPTPGLVPVRSRGACEAHSAPHSVRLGQEHKAARVLGDAGHTQDLELYPKPGPVMNAPSFL